MNTKTPMDELIDVLNEGGVIIYPTETLYGMGVDAQNAKAVEKLFQLKKRQLNKPVPILIPHKKYIGRYCKKIPSVAQVLIDTFWPGPLTIVMESDAFPKGVSHEGKVGFRVSSHPLTRTLMYQFDRCITATSANLSDKPSPKDPKEFFKIFPANSFVMLEEKDPAKPTRPSTVVDCTGDEYKILREGQISAKDINDALEGAV